jgi:hypothetical protein
MTSSYGSNLFLSTHLSFSATPTFAVIYDMPCEYKPVDKFYVSIQKTLPCRSIDPQTNMDLFSEWEPKDFSSD